MKISVGNDIVNITRFENKIAKNKIILEKVFLPSEMKNKDIRHLAGLFAAKEAVTKALNLKVGKWLDIEILHKKDGSPEVNFSSDIRNQMLDCSLSITHDGNYALATAVVVLNDKSK